MPEGEIPSLGLFSWIRLCFSERTAGEPQEKVLMKMKIASSEAGVRFILVLVTLLE
jgi:hypothetical protein